MVYINDYLDASHFLLISMFLIVIGSLLLTWETNCKDNELKNEKTSNRLRVSGASLVTTGAVATVLSLWLFSATVAGTRRVRVKPGQGYGSGTGYGGQGYGSGMGYGGGQGYNSYGTSTTY